MELIFNSCGEFRWSPGSPVSQIHSPHLHAEPPGIFSKPLRSVQMLKREWVRKATGSYRTYSSLVKITTWASDFAGGRPALREKLQSWYLSLQWKTCPWAEYSDDNEDHLNHNFSKLNNNVRDWGIINILKHQKIPYNAENQYFIEYCLCKMHTSLFYSSFLFQFHS